MKTHIVLLCAALAGCAAQGSGVDRPIRSACDDSDVIDSAKLQRDPAYAEALITRGTRCRGANIRGGA